jgi:hypothetical protein
MLGLACSNRWDDFTPKKLHEANPSGSPQLVMTSLSRWSGCQGVKSFRTKMLWFQDCFSQKKGAASCFFALAFPSNIQSLQWPGCEMDCHSFLIAKLYLVNPNETSRWLHIHSYSSLDSSDDCESSHFRQLNLEEIRGLSASSKGSPSVWLFERPSDGKRSIL